MNKKHVLLSIHNTHVLLRHESDTCVYYCVLLYNTHVLLSHESDTCITVYT